MTTTHDCPGCTACIDPALLTEADRERPTCGSPPSQEPGPILARAEYRPGLPPAAAVEAQGARGGWWQYKTKMPGLRPQLIELRVRRLPFLPDGAAPEIWGDYDGTGIDGPGWFRLEGTGWRTEQNPARKASLRAEDPSEWSWRPCTADADPLRWAAGWREAECPAP